MASYPSAIKSWPQLEDGVDTVFALHPNERGDEITAIETELGLLPKGPDASVLARLDVGPVLALTNKSGSTRSANDAVIQDTSNDSAFKTTTTKGDENLVFVVRASILNNASGYVQRSGIVTIKVQGNVTRGNYLRMSSTAAAAEDAGSSFVAGIFARAMTGYAGGGAGTVVAMLFGFTVRSLSLGAWSQVETLDTSSGTAATSATLPTDSDLFMTQFENVRADAAVDFLFRPNSDSGADKDYTTILNATLAQTTGQTSILLGSFGSGASGRIPVNGILYVPRLAQGAYIGFGGHVFSYDSNGTGAGSQNFIRGAWTNAVTITTLNFRPGSGNFAGGKIHISKLIPS